MREECQTRNYLGKVGIYICPKGSTRQDPEQPAWIVKLTCSEQGVGLYDLQRSVSP